MKYLLLLFTLLFSALNYAKWEQAMLAQDLGQVGRYHSKCQYADTYSNFHFQAIIEESSCPLYIYYDPTKENQVQVKMKEDSHKENNQK